MVMRMMWVLVVLAAAQAISVPVEGGPKHRRQVPLSPAQSMQDIDKQFAALGNHHHHHQQQHGAFRHPDVEHKQAGSHAHPGAPPAGHHVGAEATHQGHKTARRPAKQHHHHHHLVAPNMHAAPSNKHHKHVVGPKSLRRDHDSQHTSSSDYLGHKADGRSGKTHEYSGAKTSGGGHGEHHHYHHNRGEDEKQDRKHEYDEGEGVRKQYDHDDFHQSGHGNHGFGAHDAKHEEFNHRDKSGFSKGYRDKYRKNESHKLDKYWSNGREKGAYEKFGLHASHHAASDKDKVKKSQHKEGKKSDSYGKKGHHGKGHYDSDLKGHKGHGGRESQYGHHNDYAKKGGTSYGKDHHYEHGKGKA